MTVVPESEPRISFPALVFDRREETDVELDGSKIKLQLAGRGVQVVISKPVNTTLQPMGYRVDQRNGQVEEAFADIPGGQAVYRTSVRNRYKTKGELA